MADTARIDGQRNQDDSVNECIWCHRSFRREESLLKHLCEKKRRAEQQNDRAVQIALSGFQKFFIKLQGSQQTKSYSDFCDSPFYLAFVRWGRYVVDTGCFNIASYQSWLLDSNIPVDRWNSDMVYTAWMEWWIFKENRWDAVQRSIKCMDQWAQDNTSVVTHYFRYATNSRIIFDLQRGQISPWMIYCSDSGVEWMSSLTQDELGLIWNWINVDTWQKKFLMHPNWKVEMQEFLLESGF